MGLKFNLPQIKFSFAFSISKKNQAKLIKLTTLAVVGNTKRIPNRGKAKKKRNYAHVISFVAGFTVFPA